MIHVNVLFCAKPLFFLPLTYFLPSTLLTSVTLCFEQRRNKRHRASHPRCCAVSSSGGSSVGGTVAQPQSRLYLSLGGSKCNSFCGGLIWKIFKMGRGFLVLGLTVNNKTVFFSAAQCTFRQMQVSLHTTGKADHSSCQRVKLRDTNDPLEHASCRASKEGV